MTDKPPVGRLLTVRLPGLKHRAVSFRASHKEVVESQEEAVMNYSAMRTVGALALRRCAATSPARKETTMKAITRLAKATALGLALAALVVPATQAADVVMDDWFRDAASATSTLPADFRGDDWFRDARAVAATILPVNFRGDDWFRDAKPVEADTPRTLPANFVGDDSFRDASRIAAPQATHGFDWADFGLGAGSMLGGLVLLTVLAGAVLVRRGTRTLSRT